MRVLLAGFWDWGITGLLPLMLSKAGVAVDYVGPPGTAAACSSRIGTKHLEPGGMHKTIERLLDVSGQYDRVMVCDEPLLRGCWSAPTHASMRFCRFAGQPGPAARQDAVSARGQGCRSSCGPLVCGLVARRGAPGGSEHRGAGDGEAARRPCGRGVKPAKSVAGALKAADELGYPVLVEERLSGDLALMPCLFDRGRLVGALAGRKAEHILGPRGPSSVVEPWPVDEALREVAETAGAAFGIDGYASFDLFRDPSSGRLWVIELNPRAAPAHALGARFGVDMAALLRLVHEAAAPHEPQLAQGRGRVPLFPQELQRLRRKKGKAAGTGRGPPRVARFARSRGATPVSCATTSGCGETGVSFMAATEGAE